MGNARGRYKMEPPPRFRIRLLGPVAGVPISVSPQERHEANPENLMLMQRAFTRHWTAANIPRLNAYRARG